MIKNLIYTADIRRIQKKQLFTSEELEIVQQCNLSESKIQQTCKRIFDYWLEAHGFKGMFMQIDNGGKSGIGHKVKKKFEGTIAGMPDVMLLVSNKEKRTCEVFIEFKRIGTPSAIKPSESQIETHSKLIELGYTIFLTNNTVFFKNVILNHVKENLSKCLNSQKDLKKD